MGKNLLKRLIFMVEINDKFMNFSVGWIIEYKDGTYVYEGDMPWKKVVKRNIKSLSLKWFDRLWCIRDKENYLNFKRGFVTIAPSMPSSQTASLSERCIGYYDEEGKKVIYKVDDQTGVMRMEVREG